MLPHSDGTMIQKIKLSQMELAPIKQCKTIVRLLLLADKVDEYFIVKQLVNVADGQV